MAGAKKKVFDRPVTGSKRNAPEGGSGEGSSRGTDGLGDHIPCQVVPTLHRVDRVPSDASKHDPNFGHKKS